MNSEIKIIGIDLAGKPENPTGICFLNKNKLNFLSLFIDNEILDYVSKNSPDLILIDAPLSLPKGRCCLSNKCSCSEIGGHFRVAEVEMRKYGRTLPLTFRGMRMLTERGIKLAEKLKKNYEVIESHPRTIQKILGLSSPQQIEKYYPVPEGVSAHELDAALLVLNGIFYLKKHFMAFGDPEEGIIILPDANNHHITSF
jgi:predicted nuclease with RNAse H fold